MGQRYFGAASEQQWRNLSPSTGEEMLHICRPWLRWRSYFHWETGAEHLTCEYVASNARQQSCNESPGTDFAGLRKGKATANHSACCLLDSGRRWEGKLHSFATMQGVPLAVPRQRTLAAKILHIEDPFKMLQTATSVQYRGTAAFQFGRKIMAAIDTV